MRNKMLRVYKQTTHVDTRLKHAISYVAVDDRKSSVITNLQRLKSIIIGRMVA